MATFIALIDYTDQGIRNIEESPQRAEAFTEEARSSGVTVKNLYWTSGGHDGVLIFDAPDDRAATGLMLSLARGGNVRTRTLRAYDRDEMLEVLAKRT